jgi:membrane-associated phospholipid phosphatase
LALLVKFLLKRLSWVFLLLGSVAAFGQAASPVRNECSVSSLQICALHVMQDEVGIVESPFRAKPDDFLWIAPFGAATVVSIWKDSTVMSDLGHDAKRENDFRRISDYGGIYGPVAFSGAAYAVGAFRKDEHLRETGVLAAEAMTDAYILNTGLKYAINRQDPNQGDEMGKFWFHGTKGWPAGQSMPSEHAINVWAFAHVVAAEYPSWRTRLIVYSLATTVSASRVIAREHFPSDVIVGSTFGYLIGGYVFHRRAAGMGGFSLASIKTANGKGFQLTYDFNH